MWEGVVNLDGELGGKGEKCVFSRGELARKWVFGGVFGANNDPFMRLACRKLAFTVEER